MTSTVHWKMKAVAFLILCFASVALAGTNFIDGQIFIVTGGHESVKLGLVAVAACPPDEFTSAVASTKSQIESERAKLDDLRPRADESVTAASQLKNAVTEAGSSIYLSSDGFFTMLLKFSEFKTNAESLADRIRRRSEYLNSDAPYFKNLPHPIALVKTDADGKFKMELPSSISQIIIVASATREVFGPRENYFWAVKVKPPATIMLSNDNLTDAASSDSALQTLALKGIPEEDTADSLKTEGRKLAEKIVRDFQANTGRAVEMPAPAPTPMRMIMLTQPVSVQVQFGTVTLPAGTKLEFVSRAGGEVHVRYLNSEEMIPISATDLK